MSLNMEICFCVDFFFIYIFYMIYFYGVLAYFIYIYSNLPTE